MNSVTDMGPSEPPFSQGTCPWDPIFEACAKVGTEWHITERWMGYDLTDETDLRGAEQYRAFLRERGLV